MPPDDPPSYYDISEDIIELLESVKGTPPPDETDLDAKYFDYQSPGDVHSSLGSDGDADNLPDPNQDFLPEGDSPPGTPRDQEQGLPPT